MILKKIFTSLNINIIPHFINKPFCLRQINTFEHIYPLYIEINLLQLCINRKL